MNLRVATGDDLDGIVATLTAAFETDPLWGWAFTERQNLETWWRFLVTSALRYPWAWIADDYAAVSVWIPPGGVELTVEEEAAIEPLLNELIGARATEVLELLERFEDAHPTDRPHYYLSLLATHPDHRGKGLGMALLADSLTRIDAEGMPAYLESSNSANDPRYEREGFTRIGRFMRPDGEVSVSTMWRDAPTGQPPSRFAPPS
jgi:GNAT superfamily N-acetyltransferase